MAQAKKADSVEDVGKIQFFGTPDRNVRGEISSSIPAWMLRQHVEELEEDVARQSRALEFNRLPAENIPYAREELRALKARLKEIQDSRPKLVGAQKDAVAKVRGELAEQIRATMPTLRDDRNGFVRPHDEYRRLKERHIKIDPKMAESLGIEAKGGKITGDQANRAYSILSAALNENGSTENLRRDFGQSAYRTEDPFTQEILSHGR